MTTKKTMKVFYETWTESERGWGTRPDGCSFHIDNAERDRFVKEYWDKQPPETPDEYSRPDGNGMYVQIPCKHKIALQLLSTKSVRVFSNSVAGQLIEN